MKALFTICILFTLLCSCEEELKKTSIGDGKYETTEQLNDSIILVKTFNSKQILEGKDYENIKTRIHKMYFLDENGKLSETAIAFFNKDNTNFSYADCRYFNSSGKLLYRKILNVDDQIIAHYYYDSTLNLKRQVFYNENYNSIRSEISFNKNGSVNQEHSKYLTIKKKHDKLVLHPSWFSGIHKIATISIYSLKGTEQIFEKEINFKNTRELVVGLHELDTSKIYAIIATAQRGYVDGLCLMENTGILIDDFNDIPENNLHPVILKNGQVHSGKYLLQAK
jgi:hypothetical protein